MSKFFRIGNNHIKKDSILSVHLEKTIFGNNHIKIVTNEMKGSWLLGCGDLDHVSHKLLYYGDFIAAKRDYDEYIKKLDQ